jgi:cytochrome c biogenesis protein
MNVDDATGKPPRNSGSRLQLEFRGSMNLAITLLVTAGIASIIGTVLKQNEAYQNYIIKFGPFWFDVFNSLGRYDVYSAAATESAANSMAIISSCNRCRSASR